LLVAAGSIDIAALKSFRILRSVSVMTFLLLQRLR
jgi:hypothetical protein